MTENPSDTPADTPETPETDDTAIPQAESADDALPLWRQALNDKDHALHTAVWLLFREHMNPRYATKRLADQREEVIELLYVILDEDYLYIVDAPGAGFAPVNAVRLLGEWQVVEAAPLLIDILEQEDPDAFVRDASVLALENMVHDVKAQLLMQGEMYLAQSISDDFDDEFDITYGSILSKLHGDADAFEFNRRLLEKYRDQELNTQFIVEMLLYSDYDKAVAYLNKRMKKKPFRKYRDRIEMLYQSVRQHLDEMAAEEAAEQAKQAADDSTADTPSDTTDKADTSDAPDEEAGT